MKKLLFLISMTGCNFSLSKEEIETGHKLCESYDGAKYFSKYNMICFEVACEGKRSIRFCQID